MQYDRTAPRDTQIRCHEHERALLVQEARAALRTLKATRVQRTRPATVPTEEPIACERRDGCTCHLCTRDQEAARNCMPRRASTSTMPSMATTASKASMARSTSTATSLWSARKATTTQMSTVAAGHARASSARAVASASCASTRRVSDATRRAADANVDSASWGELTRTRSCEDGGSCSQPVGSFARADALAPACMNACTNTHTGTHASMRAGVQADIYVEAYAHACASMNASTQAQGHADSNFYSHEASRPHDDANTRAHSPARSRAHGRANAHTHRRTHSCTPSHAIRWTEGELPVSAQRRRGATSARRQLIGHFSAAQNELRPETAPSRVSTHAAPESMHAAPECMHNRPHRESSTHLLIDEDAWPDEDSKMGVSHGERLTATSSPSLPFAAWGPAETMVSAERVGRAPQHSLDESTCAVGPTSVLCSAASSTPTVALKVGPSHCVAHQACVQTSEERRTSTCVGDSSKWGLRDEFQGGIGDEVCKAGQGGGSGNVLRACRAAQSAEGAMSSGKERVAAQSTEDENRHEAVAAQAGEKVTAESEAEVAVDPQAETGAEEEEEETGEELTTGTVTVEARPAAAEASTARALPPGLSNVDSDDDIAEAHSLSLRALRRRVAQAAARQRQVEKECLSELSSLGKRTHAPTIAHDAGPVYTSAAHRSLSPSLLLPLPTSALTIAAARQRHASATQQVRAHGTTRQQQQQPPLSPPSPALAPTSMQTNAQTHVPKQSPKDAPLHARMHAQTHAQQTHAQRPEAHEQAALGMVEGEVGVESRETGEQPAGGAKGRSAEEGAVACGTNSNAHAAAADRLDAGVGTGSMGAETGMAAMAEGSVRNMATEEAAEADGGCSWRNIVAGSTLGSALASGVVPGSAEAESAVVDALVAADFGYAYATAVEAARPSRPFAHQPFNSIDFPTSRLELPSTCSDVLPIDGSGRTDTASRGSPALATYGGDQHQPPMPTQHQPLSSCLLNVTTSVDQPDCSASVNLVSQSDEFPKLESKSEVRTRASERRRRARQHLEDVKRVLHSDSSNLRVRQASHPSPPQQPSPCPALPALLTSTQHLESTLIVASNAAAPASATAAVSYRDHCVSLTLFVSRVLLDVADRAVERSLWAACGRNVQPFDG